MFNLISLQDQMFTMNRGLTFKKKLYRHQTKNGNNSENRSNNGGTLI